MFKHTDKATDDKHLHPHAGHEDRRAGDESPSSKKDEPYVARIWLDDHSELPLIEVKSKDAGHSLAKSVLANGHDFETESGSHQFVPARRIKQVIVTKKLEGSMPESTAA